MRKFGKINESELPENLLDLGPEQVLRKLCGANYKEPGPDGTEQIIDPQYAQILKAGMTDNEGHSDEAITLRSGGSKPAKDLVPTQANIDADKSLADQIYCLYGNLNVALQPYVALSQNAPKPGMVASPGGQFPILTFMSKYIIDGHHRWSQVCMTNPDCELLISDIIVPGLNSAEDAIKIQTLAHVILLALKGKSIVKDARGTNLLELDEATLMSMVKEGKGMKKGLPISQESLTLLSEAYEKSGGKVGCQGDPESAAIMYVEKGLPALKAAAAQNPARIERKFMPQPGDSGDKGQLTVGGTVASTLTNDLARGVVNFLNPKPSDVKTETSDVKTESRVIKTYEKFIQQYKK